MFGIEAELAAASAPVMVVLAFSIPLHLLYIAGTYFLEAIKKPGISTVVMWLANIVNLALNLLWVPEHGAMGSAWATVVRACFLGVALLLCIWLLRDDAHLWRAHARPPWAELWRAAGGGHCGGGEPGGGSGRVLGHDGDRRAHRR